MTKFLFFVPVARSTLTAAHGPLSGPDTLCSFTGSGQGRLGWFWLLCVVGTELHTLLAAVIRTGALKSRRN